MLTSIEIEGFKSFGSQRLRVPLSPLNFIVGPNASGKTNFLAILRFLRDALRQGTQHAVNELGGASEVVNKRERQRQVHKPLRIRATLNDSVSLKPPGDGPPVTMTNFDYLLEVDLRALADIPCVSRETLTVDIVQGQAKEKYSLVRDRKTVRVTHPPSLGGPKDQEFPVPEQERSRPAVNAGFFSLPSVVFRTIVEKWSFFNISPRVARQPYKEGPDAWLGMYGENLSVVLHRLQSANGKIGLSELVAGLRGAVPGLKDIKVVKDKFENKWHLQVEEEGIRARIQPHSISDGTIRLIGLLVIANTGAAADGGLVAIEEPENGIHPHLAEHIVSVFRAATAGSQIIATTHNPTFLDFLEPKEILLCGKVAGFTRVRRADEKEEVASFQKHFSLGDLWVQGTFDEFFQDD